MNKPNRSLEDSIDSDDLQQEKKAQKYRKAKDELSAEVSDISLGENKMGSMKSKTKNRFNRKKRKMVKRSTVEPNRSLRTMFISE